MDDDRPRFGGVSFWENDISAYLSPIGNSPQCDANGAPLVGGKIATYIGGSVNTPTATYTSSAGTTPQANPIILNSRGIPDNPIWLAAGVTTKIVISDANNVVLQTIDNVQGINDPSTVAAPDQWIAYGAAPTFLNTVSFSVAGDQTATLEPLRRIKAQCSGGTVYGTISTSSFSLGLTTVTITPDTVLTLDSGLSAVSYGLLTYSNRSVPPQPGELIAVQVISATGTYTPSKGTRAVQVLLQAGGGGGGGTAATGAGQQAAGSGGGAGGWAMSYLTSGFSGVTVTIGAGGITNTGGTGGNGGTTSFGAVFSATGGSGGALGPTISTASAALVQGAVGGGSSGANIAGASGGQGGMSFYTAGGGVVAGSGGSGYFGQGGTTVNGSNNGTAAAAKGGGGGGAAQGTASAVALTGGGGGAGLAIIWEYA